MPKALIEVVLRGSKLTSFILGSPLFLIGTPDDCIAELRRRQRDWGLSEVVLSGAGASDLLERFGREILPHI